MGCRELEPVLKQRPAPLQGQAPQLAAEGLPRQLCTSPAPPLSKNPCRRCGTTV